MKKIINRLINCGDNHSSDGCGPVLQRGFILVAAISLSFVSVLQDSTCFAGIGPNPELVVSQKVANDLSADSMHGMRDLTKGEETWIDGDTIRYMMVSFRDQETSPLLALLDQLKGIRLSRDDKRLYITIEYPDALSLSIHSFKDAPSWQIYGLVVPKVSKFSVEMNDGVIELREIETSEIAGSWQLQVNMPFLPDAIYMRNASIDLVNGEISVGAGFLDNLVAVVAQAKIKETDITYMGIAFWQSVLESLRITRWFESE